MQRYSRQQRPSRAKAERRVAPPVVVRGLRCSRPNRGAQVLARPEESRGILRTRDAPVSRVQFIAADKLCYSVTITGGHHHAFSRLVARRWLLDHLRTRLVTDALQTALTTQTLVVST